MSWCWLNKKNTDVKWNNTWFDSSIGFLIWTAYFMNKTFDLISQVPSAKCWMNKKKLISVSEWISWYFMTKTFDYHKWQVSKAWHIWNVFVQFLGYFLPLNWENCDKRDLFGCAQLLQQKNVQTKCVKNWKLKKLSIVSIKCFQNRAKTFPNRLCIDVHRCVIR